MTVMVAPPAMLQAAPGPYVKAPLAEEVPVGGWLTIVAIGKTMIAEKFSGAAKAKAQQS